MNKINRIKELILLLNEASVAYYKYDKPTISDKEYDSMYDELTELEQSTRIIMSNSPTQKVQGEILDGLTKVAHSKPMLSANKTKDIEDIKKFVSNQLCVEMWKLDGLTIVIRYEDGMYKQAITRGGGDIGEDVTHTIKHCINLPLQLSQNVDITVRGECVISWENFRKINETLEEQYSHPRNLAAGSCRQLDSNIAKERYLEFIAFELVQDNNEEKLDTDVSLGYLSDLGIQVTEREFVQNGVAEVEDVDLKFDPNIYKYPVDGTIYKYESYSYGESLGSTSHHPLNMIARKWEDETYETVLKDIEWSTSRTGLINPVAIFEPIDLGGAITTRATLHNISYMEDLQLGIGDIITVYRANMVIPKVDDNLTRSDTCIVPNVCPDCGGSVEIRNENGSKTLHCTNPSCHAKLLGKFIHFTSKQAMNIDGLSDSTLSKFVDLGWINSLWDIYNLKVYKDEMMKLEGFGRKSTDKLLDAIENSKQVKFESFLYSLGISLIGRSASKTISKHCDGSSSEFEELINNSFNFSDLDDFGDKMCESIRSWFSNSDNSYIYYTLVNLMDFEKENKNIHSTNTLQNKSICITGKLIKYPNRDALVSDINLHGGKVVSSVTSKTDILLTNDTTSGSSKNTKAKQLNIPIITEEEFIKMVGE